MSEMLPLSHNRELAAELAQQVQAEPKECFRNSVLAQYAYDERLRPASREAAGAIYVEGILLIMGGLLIEHGWLGIDGRIVDVTLDDIEPKCYTPIFKYSKAEVRPHVARHRRLPFFQYFRERQEIFMQTQWQMYQEMAGAGSEVVDLLDGL